MFIENARLCPCLCSRAVRVRWHFIVKEKLKWRRKKYSRFQRIMNDSRHLPSGLSRNIPNLSVVWDLYEKAHTHNSQCGCEHCAPYQYNSSIQTLGVASEKSIEIIIRVVKLDKYSISLVPAIKFSKPHVLEVEQLLFGTVWGMKYARFAFVKQLDIVVVKTTLKFFIQLFTAIFFQKKICGLSVTFKTFRERKKINIVLINGHFFLTLCRKLANKCQLRHRRSVVFNK